MNYTIELMIYEKWAGIPQLSPGGGRFLSGSALFSWQRYEFFV